MVQAGLTRAWRGRHAALLLWALGALVALPSALLTRHVVQRFFGPRLVAETVAARLEPLYAADLFFAKQDLLTSYLPIVVGAVLAWALLSPLRHGLALGGAAEGGVRGMVLAGASFFGLLRLAPMVWAAGALLVAGPMVVAFELGSSGVESWVDERAVLGVRLALVACLALWMAWLRGAAELMRARMVVDGAPSARAAFVRGGLGAMLRPWRALQPVLVFSGASLLLTLLVSLLDARLVRDGWGFFFVGIALQQLTALARAFLEVALSGAVLEGREAA